MRSVLGDLLERDAGYDHVVVDMEAGLEHLSRGTTRHVDTLLTVAEPYYRSLETARRVCALAGELGIARIHILPNKVRDATEAEAIREFGDRHGLRILEAVPYDEAVADASRRGAPFFSPDDATSVAMAGIHSLAGRLLAS